MSRCARIVSDISALARRDWDQLEHHDNPFLSHPFLLALEASGSVCAATGWQPHHLCLFEDERLVAFAPTYLKSHSHGEFVFDWAWADAYHRHGRNYYPKLLTAVPYSPVVGPRLLIQRQHPRAQELRAGLVQLALEQCEALNLSSWHCNFSADEDDTALQHPALLARSDWQFHWFNQGYGSFEEFLSTLRAKKRKNIRRDRRLVQEAGIHFALRTGAQLRDAELDFIYACYQATFTAHGNHAALTRDFFQRLAGGLPDGMLAVIAARGDEPLAMSLFLVGGGRLYGRYWGCLETVPGLHFETAYHQGIDYCIAQGLKVFEPGAQGEHKISRGFTPVCTHSFHLVRDAAFRAAIADFLLQEQAWLEQYRQELAEHQPYRAVDDT